jgi:DNA invertase Pin-like site-specific DNA recombinase
MMNESPRIQPEHLRRLAAVYIRQSDPKQVRENTASTEQQYELIKRALDLGWCRDQVRFYDADLGATATIPGRREEFGQLAADVGMRRVGIVVGLDVTRMSRNNSDWYRLLDLCGICDTLIADSDGLYHPARYNDRLVLGMKGTMSEAEMHFRKERMQGAIETRAAKGTLRKGLPVGLEYGEDKKVRLALDESIRHAIELVFEKFAQLGTAYQVYRYFQAEGLLLPARRWHERNVRWVKPRYSAFRAILNNPRYAGAYVYGRTRRLQSVDEQGRIQVQTEHLPIEQWKVVIEDQHPGYISWETFVSNQKCLAENYLAGSDGEASRVLRRGHALLAGLIRCGVCGRRMSPCYPGNGNSVRYVCSRARLSGGLDGAKCQSIAGTRIHAAVVEAFLEALSPASMQVALATLEHIDAEQDAAVQQLEDRREHARYEAERARRQYDAVEPENRLVARTLESEWNRRLAALGEIEQQIEERRHQLPPTPLTPEERIRLMELGLDLRRIWEAPTTLPQERKQLLRAVFEDVMVLVDRDARLARITLIWQGGATTKLDVQIPRVGVRIEVDADDVVEEVRKMVASMTDAQIARTLVRRGIRTAMGLPFNVQRVRALRSRHGIAAVRHAPSPSGEPALTAGQAAEALGVTLTTVLRWLRDGFLVGEQVSPRAPWQIKEASLKELKTARKAPKGWMPLKEAAKAAGVTRETVLHLARTGQVATIMVGTGRKRGLRFDAIPIGCTAQMSLPVHP